jgi:hypothetical protein
MQYTEQQLSKLIEDVETMFKSALAKEEGSDNSETLAKSEEASELATEAKVEEVTEQVEAAQEQPLAKAEDEKKDEKKEEHKDEKCDYDDEDMEEMHKMYTSMSKGELDAHRNAVHKSWMAKFGEMSMAKSEEVKVEEKVKAEEAKPEANSDLALLKSEIEAKNTENEKLKKSLDTVAEILTKLVKKSAPAGKAITSYEAVTKSEGAAEEKVLSKGEITAILNKKAADPTMSK